MGQFVRATDGMAEACRALDFPVVSGNVSLYNETSGIAIPPTPAIGGVGLLRDYHARMGFGGYQAGDQVILIGHTSDRLGATLALRELWGREDGAPPNVDLMAEKAAGLAVRAAIDQGLLTACHDLSDGGLALGLVDLVLASGVGLAVQVTGELSLEALLFSEDQGRYLVLVDPAKADLVYALLEAAGVPAAPLGQAGGCELAIGDCCAIDIDDLRAAHEGWMPQWIAERAAAQ
jgi:phosphoribosylformylglycinamidine synthase